MPHISKTDEFSEKLRKGREVIFKNFYCKIWTFKQGCYSMKLIQKGLFRVCFQPITMLNICTTCNSWEIGSYNTQQCLHMNIRTFVTILSRNLQYNFLKMRGDQRQFRTFPKIHPFWWLGASLKVTFTAIMIILVVTSWSRIFASLCASDQ